MPADVWAFRERAGRAAAKPDRGCTVGDADCYTPIADAVIAEFAKPTDAMIDAAYLRIRPQLYRILQSPARGLVPSTVAQDRPAKAQRAVGHCRRRGRGRSFFIRGARPAGSPR
jgi:hypothetical protein